MRFSAIVGVFGHRQVGKTKLVERIAERYVSLDRQPQLESANDDPARFLRTQMGSPLVIDECQFSPALFPEMKEWVREHPKPGQLLLTGSVRFSSRKAIRESLTGRILTWELLPMDFSECFEAPLPDSLLRLLKSKSVEIDLLPAKYYSAKAYLRYLHQGGLPGVFAVHDESIRVQRFEAQLETILERDLRLVLETSLPLRTLRNLLAELARDQGEPLSFASLSRKTRISTPTLRKLIRAFESLFLIRVIETEGSERKPVVFLEDQGEAFHLVGGRTTEFYDLQRFIFSQIRPQINYRPKERIRLFQFRNRGGACVPFCLQDPKGTLGLIPILQESPIGSALAGARSFLKTFPKSKVLFIHSGDSDTIISREIRSVGLGRIL